MLRACIVLFSLFLTLGLGHAEQVITPGFRSINIVSENEYVDVALWYPAHRNPSVLRYVDWTFRSAHGAAPAKGQFPLLVLSHDSAGSRLSLHPLAIALTRQGFVVAAVTHRFDNTDNLDDLFSAHLLDHRANEIQNLITSLLNMPVAAPLIDAERIGVLGVGPGGAAALLLGGARLDRRGWASYCQRTTTADPYCSPWAKPLMQSMAETPKLGQTYHDPRVKAVAAVAPGYGMFFTEEGLTGMNVPVLVAQADLDRINLAPHHANAIYANLPLSGQFTVLRYTNTASLMAPCAPSLQATMPELCLAASNEERQNSFSQLTTQALAFFTKELKQVQPPSPITPLEAALTELAPLPAPPIPPSETEIVIP